MRIPRPLLLLPILLLTGCSSQLWQTTPVAADPLAIRGSVHGGQQPVTGATIQLYTVGTSADKSAATPLLTQTVTTDSSGSFTITGLYTCTSATQVYLTATGGNPGGATANPNLALMAALGPCTALTPATFIVIDENTTVAATSALEPYMSSPAAIGSATSDASALASAFTLAAQYVSTASGQAPGAGIPSGYSDPISLINTLGNIMSACINSTGGTAGDSTNCGTLFTNTTPITGAAPTNTITAMLNIAKNPTANLTALYNLAPATGPFQPQLTAAPVSLQLNLVPTTVTRTFYTFPETDKSVTPLYALINSAQRTIDMTMYELVDTTFSADLVAACNRGVRVRVILDQNDEKSSNTPAYNQLNATTNCSAAYANPAFQVTHQKSFIIDESQVAILSLNLTSRYYALTRDYGLVENDPNDIAAIQATFNTDYASTTDYNYQPGAGDDLIWSPTTAQADLLGIINSAQSTLLVENEEMSASNIVTALENACKRGVTTHIAMTDTGSYHANFSALTAAGCGVHLFADNSTTLYIHAKAILADYGLPAANAYMGSINFSTASMTQNRELGLYITNPSIQQTIYTTITTDYTNAPPSTY